MNRQSKKQPPVSFAVLSALGVHDVGPMQQEQGSAGKQLTQKLTKGKKPPRSKSASPLIFTSKSVAMQALMDGVRNGYSEYVCGSTPVEKLTKAVAVFDKNYLAFADRNERTRRKRRSLGNVSAVLLLRQDRVDWWLMATPKEAGGHLIHSAERLKNSAEPTERLEIDGFELVRTPKDGTSTSKLTWRMTSAKYQNIRQHVIDTVRSRSYSRMHNLLYQLYSMPGFSGIRCQIGNLVALYRAEVKRGGFKEAPKPPRKLRYLRRIPHSGLTVREVLSSVSQG